MSKLNRLLDKVDEQLDKFLTSRLYPLLMVAALIVFLCLIARL